MKKKLFSTFSIILVITVFIQILNMVKSIFLASKFGVSQEIDAFYLSNAYTVTIFNIIGIAITTICIPFFSATKDNIIKKKESIESFFSILYILTLILVICIFLFLLIFKDILLVGFSRENIILFFIISLILFLGQFFRIQTAISTAILQSNDNFILPKLSNLISAYIPVGYLIINKNFNLIGLSRMIALGYIFEMILLLVKQFRYSEYRYKLGFGLKRIDNTTKKLLLNIIPVLISSTVFQIQLLFANSVIVLFGDGYVTILSNTNQIVGIFQILFVSNIITIMYPKISKEVKVNFADSVSNLVEYINKTNILVILLVWGYVGFGRELIEILFVRGAFTNNDANSVYKFGLVLIFCLPFSVIRDYFYRLLYSIDKMKIPTYNSMGTVVMNIVFIFVFIKFLGVYSIVFSSLFSTLWSLVSLNFKLKKIGITYNYKLIFKNLLLYNFFGFMMFQIINNYRFNLGNLYLNFIVNVFLATIMYSLFILVYYKFRGKKNEKID